MVNHAFVGNNVNGDKSSLNERGYRTNQGDEADWGSRIQKVDEESNASAPVDPLSHKLTENEDSDDVIDNSATKIFLTPKDFKNNSK